MPHRLRRVPCASEVNILQTEVGGDQGLVAPRNSDYGTVIPYADSAIQKNAASFGCPADSGNQTFFMEGQGAINIARAGRTWAGKNCVRAGRSLP